MSFIWASLVGPIVSVSSYNNSNLNFVLNQVKAQQVFIIAVFKKCKVITVITVLSVLEMYFFVNVSFAI